MVPVMPNRVIIGAQWGDEGKGRITDFLAVEADLIIRYQGGSNAGHTVITGEERFELHLIPSGILYPQKESIIGNGVMLDPVLLVQEMDQLEKRGVDLSGLKISAQTHLIFPYHLLLDQQEEERLVHQIGTTRRGIGPGYEDKVARRGIRLHHLYHEEVLRSLLEENLNRVKRLFPTLNDKQEEISLEDSMETYLACGKRLRPHLVENLPLFIHNRIAAGKQVLLEGAQGCLLDVDHGTYPYVTSSSPGISGALSGSGISPGLIHEIYGVVKVYQTRVGEGPFPTEQKNGEGNQLREQGKEYGVTTGRPRRCGWLDLPLLRHAIRVNGFTHLILTKLDVLTGFPRIRICTAYQKGEDVYGEVSPDPLFLKEAQPIYQDFPGWEEPLTGIVKSASLPEEAKTLVDFIAQETNSPIAFISVGPERRQIIKGGGA